MATSESNALHIACMTGCQEEVVSFLARGGNIESRDEHGRTPLMIACRTGNLELVRLLLGKAADVNAKNRNGTTALMFAKTAAMGSRDFRVLDALIEAGANVNDRDVAGRTALDYAIEGADKVLAYLASKGATL